MKIVINSCYGGFSLSREAVKLLAAKNGRECYFFGARKPDGGIDLDIYGPDDESSMFWNAFDIPNPNEVLKDGKPWHEMSMEERGERNSLYDKHSLNKRPDNRTDPLLIEVVEQLGEAANGDCAKLKVIEIPDGIEYEIQEYDGVESVHQVHSSWP